jgi:hypothetical protein
MARMQRTPGASPSRTPGEKQTSSGPSLAAVPAPADVAARAYEIWRASGCPEGKSEEHWYAAERELRAQASRPHRA